MSDTNNCEICRERQPLRTLKVNSVFVWICELCFPEITTEIKEKPWGLNIEPAE
jgi:hypothetical protein